MLMDNIDILIIDDDEMVAELSKSILEEEKYKIETLMDSTLAAEKIKKSRPKLVITDIMMPGITGMDICKFVKSNPELKDTKIIVMSGKSFDIEKQRAFNFGADYFIQKPYDVSNFRKTVSDVLNGKIKFVLPTPKQDAEVIKDSPKESKLTPDQMRLTIWGARGLSPLIPNSSSGYGRQTPCVSIETKENIFIFDAGTGIIELGKKIVSEKRYYKDIWIMLTHFHMDHVLGLSQFAPFYDKEFNIHLVAVNDPEKSLKELAQSALYSSFASRNIQPVANVDVNEILEDSYDLVKEPLVQLSAIYANHPTNTLIYKIHVLGRNIVYAPDSELFADATAFQDYNEKMADFVKDVDILIHDAALADEDYPKYKDRGHSCVSNVVDFVISKTKIKELVLFHAMPEYTDETIDQMMLAAVTRIAHNGASVICHMAKEKQEFNIKGR